ncbi:hypothetical protein ACHMW5_35990 (plasmid) [Azospirillum melinis]|uniref:hypothetical protein n=1 Tax=Azospirillum melinis TaxID=328839 RepID=UPI0037578B73
MESSPSQDGLKEVTIDEALAQGEKDNKYADADELQEKVLTETFYGWGIQRYADFLRWHPADPGGRCTQGYTDRPAANLQSISEYGGCFVNLADGNKASVTRYRLIFS